MRDRIAPAAGMPRDVEHSFRRVSNPARDDGHGGHNLRLR